MIGIYKITNLINNKCYVGQSQDIEKRWQEHIYGNKPSVIHKAIIKYGKENFKFEVLEECNQNELDEREIFWIKEYNSFENGYNLTRGGASGFKYDIDAVYEDYLKTQNMTQTAKNIGCSKGTVHNILKLFGIDETESQLEKQIDKIDPNTLNIIATYESISQAALSEKIHKSSIQAVLSGKHNSCNGFFWQFHNENRDFSNKKITTWKRRVKQYDLNGNYIQTFESMTEAVKSLGKTSTAISSITAVCQGKKPTAFSYKWAYDIDEIPEKFTQPPKQRKINQYDLNNNFIQSFDSLKDANIALGKDPKQSHISQVCKGKSKTAYGFIWRYADN